MSGVDLKVVSYIWCCGTSRAVEVLQLVISSIRVSSGVASDSRHYYHYRIMLKLMSFAKCCSYYC